MSCHDAGRHLPQVQRGQPGDHLGGEEGGEVASSSSPAGGDSVQVAGDNGEEEEEGGGGRQRRGRRPQSPHGGRGGNIASGSNSIQFIQMRRIAVKNIILYK